MSEPESSKDHRRQHLLNVASAVLMHTPTASLADIAQQAGVGKATLHRYFATRDDLMLALGYQALTTINHAIQACQLALGTVPDALARLAEALIPLGDKWHFLLHEPILDTHPDFVTADHLTQQPVLELLQRGQRDGSIRTDLSAEWLLHILNYALYATWAGVYEGKIARKEAGRLLVTTLLHGMTPR